VGVVVKTCPLVEEVEHREGEGEGEGAVYGIQNLKAFVALVGGEGLKGLPEVLVDF